MLQIESGPFSFKKGTEPYIIAGPCSAETPEQVDVIAESLAQSGKVQLMRAGIWKPRTRPNSFEGVGNIGLPWLQQAQDRFGIPVAVEVANAAHVEQALNHDIKVLWIGARTTVSPFAVQEIAEALRGVKVPVMVKNPINPDLGLWLGAFERLNQMGITEIAGIHRGFSSHDKRFRYAPYWEIPIRLKTEYPELPLICDPSHIAGRVDKIDYIAQKALDLDFDGLMVEVHNKPDEALSDPQQQLTPSRFFNLLESLVVRSSESKSLEFEMNLEQLRSEIDEIDYEVLRSLQKRMEVVEKIGAFKKRNDVTILQLERWRTILNTRIPYAKDLGLSQEFIERSLQAIHDESIRIQTRIMQNQKGKID